MSKFSCRRLPLVCSPWRRHSQYIANLQNVKHLSKEIFEKLGARRSRCAKSLVGEEAQNWSLPQLWAWIRKYGRAHFLRPCPRDLGAQHESVVRVHSGRTWTSSRLHDNGRPHVSIMGDQSSVLLGTHILIHAHPCMSTKIGRQSTPTHFHSAPPSPATLGHTLPRNFGCPTARWSPTFRATLDGHTLVWSPIKFVDSHTIVWTPSARLPWASTKFCGCSHIHLDGHENLWALTHLRGCPKYRRRWMPTPHIWMPNDGNLLGAQLCGQLHAFWTSTTLWLESHVICVGFPQNCLGDHEMLWTPKQIPSWTSTKSCGHPRKFVGLHIQSWAPSKHRSWAPNITKHGRPTCVCWCPRRCYGRASRISWAPREYVWTFTRLSGRPSSATWESITHLLGAHETCVADH